MIINYEFSPWIVLQCDSLEAPTAVPTSAPTAAPTSSPTTQPKLDFYYFTLPFTLADRFSEKDMDNFAGFPFHTYFQNALTAGASATIIKLSEICNPNFRSSVGYTCSQLSESFCAERKNNMIGVTQLLGQANQRAWHTSGEPVWETYLNCPICGCGSNGADNLNNIIQDLSQEDWSQTRS